MSSAPPVFPSSPSGLRPLVIYGLGALLLIGGAWFGTYAYVVAQALLWTQTSLLRGPIVLLFLLAAVSGGGGWVHSRLRGRAMPGLLSPPELAVLYAMLCMGTCAGGYGWVQILINQMAAPFYFATSSSGFKERLWPHIPGWLAPRDEATLNGFFRGNSRLYEPAHLAGWAVPVLAWSGFIIALFWTLLCVSALVRRAWIEEERLTFPLVLLPLEIAGAGQIRDGQNRPFWRSPWMWIGFGLAGALESVNFLNFLYPSVPTIPIKPGMGFNEIGALFTTRPLSAVGRLCLSFYPFALGIGYLLPTDVSFSCWSLYLGSKALLVICAALGLSDGTPSVSGRLPYLREQSMGAFIGIALFSLWTARASLRFAWATAFGENRPKKAADDGTELLTPRGAFLGGAVGIGVAGVFLFAAGLGPWGIVLFLLSFLLCALTLARVVSEVGAGWAWAPPWSPAMFAADALGIDNLGAQQTTILVGSLQWTNDMRDNPLPQQMQALKMASGLALPARAYLGPLVFAIVLGTFAAFWAHLDIYYTWGAATAKVRPALASGATGPARYAATLILTPTHVDTAGLGAAGVGGIFAIALSLLRQKLVGWPLHPLGYVISTTQTMEYLWCPFLLSWAAKVITLRYGGIRAFRAALPFALGLILGDYVVPVLWGVFGLVTNSQMYLAFPH